MGIEDVSTEFGLLSSFHGGDVGLTVDAIMPASLMP
jgi:hypothetical protein